MPDYSKEKRQAMADKGHAMPDSERGGRYPIRNRADLERAIQAVGRAKGGDAGRAAVRRFIIKRAKALGLTNLIPSSWAADGSLKG